MTARWPTTRKDPMNEALEALVAARREHERELEQIEAAEAMDAIERMRRGHVAERSD